MPKFTDDLVAVSVCKDLIILKKVFRKAQTSSSIGQIRKECRSTQKTTKVMVFGDSVKEIKVKVGDKVIGIVSSYKFIGVI